MKFSHIIIHHSGTAKATFEEIRRRHVEELGFRDFGYHYFLPNGNGGEDGSVIPGRPLTMGSCQARGFNSKSIGILLAGNFDLYFVSKKQWSALVCLVKNLMKEYGIFADDVLGHREIFPLRGLPSEKTCPGVKFCCDKFRREVYDGDSEIFSDGLRRSYFSRISVDGVVTDSIDMQMLDNKPYIRAVDIEQIADVSVEYLPKMRMLEIKKKGIKDNGSMS